MKNSIQFWAFLVLSTLAAYSLANAAPVATCTFGSYKTFGKLELLDDGSVTGTGQGSGSSTEFDLTTLPDLYHILIMRQDSETFLVYNNGSFSHGKPEDNNHVFLVEFATGVQAITLKAVNHKYEAPEVGSGSGMEEGGEEEEEEEEEKESEGMEMVVMEDCYLGFDDEGKPMCYPSKVADNGTDPLVEVLFFTPCFN